MSVMDTEKKKKAAGAAANYRGQPQFGENRNEAVRYEIFGDGWFLTVRVTETPSLKYVSAWMYDNGGIRDLYCGPDAMTRSGSSHLKLVSDRLTVEADDEKGHIVLKAMDGGNLDIKFKSPITSSWEIPPGDTAIHQPFLDVEVTIDGRTRSAIGYCKRYWYVEDIDYWNWRFILGVIRYHGAPRMLWTAEANFAHEKYDYFKFVSPDGSIISAKPDDSRHRETKAFGILNGKECEAHVEELGRIVRDLRSDRMDTRIITKFCKLKFIEAGEVHTGYALHEIGSGTAR
ncbi:MAG: hypothetical protein AB7K04_03230 [Pseudorhodoplanes sp.]